MTAFPVPLVCPRCHVRLRDAGERLACDACRRDYPVVLGIPDLRVEPDVWLDFAADRQKAAELERQAEGEDFAGTVRRYWALTPDTPPHLAERHIHHVLAAASRSRDWLAHQGPRAAERSGPWLDAGCGTADLAAAAPEGIRVVSCDVALRWLVVARKRLGEARRPALLVCCNAEHLPFPEAAFACVLALGLIEHVSQPAQVLCEARRVLRRNGDLRLRTVNRYSVLSEPHVHVWGVGFIPRRLADRYVRWRSGQRYLHHHPLSAPEIRRLAAEAGFVDIDVSAARAIDHDRSRLGAGIGRLAGLYNVLARVPGVGVLVRGVAPALDVRATAP